MAKRKAKDEDLDSEFEYSQDKRRQTWRDDPLASHKPPQVTHVPTHSTALPSKQLLVQERDKEEWRTRRYHLLAMDAYSRHKALVNQYMLSVGRGIEHFERSTERDRNDYDVLKEEHKFLWEPGDQATTWEKKLSKAYYNKLFKEYAIADLSRYKENMVAMRWRIEKEVVEGKGQFICGNKHCLERSDLTSWEVNFSYQEQGESKNALVKLRLCPKCSGKLNYHKKRRVWKGSTKSKTGTSLKSGDSSRQRSGASKKHKREKRRKKKHGDDKTRKHRDSDSDISSTSEHEHTATHSDESGSEGDGQGSSSQDGSGVWSKPAEAFLEKSKVEEFDDYFKDMLL